jgi:DNA-binding MarR family transcriptional regulator
MVLGPALRRAWVGYQRQMDAELAAAGFDDRTLPDGRVLRICARSSEVTIADISRELEMTRQGAAKLVAGLRERRYVTLRASARDGREKFVVLTPKAVAYLTAQRKAARKIERRVRAEVGADAYDAMQRVLVTLAGDEQPRLRHYLRVGSAHVG